MNIIFWAFWLAAAIVLYTWILFPLLVFLRARLFARPCQAADISPTVSVVVAAHNEAQQIAARLDNLLGLDYPRERLEVIVASDGSTDETNQIAEAYAERGVRLLALPRAGKIPTLNAGVAAATGEVLVFTDANTLFAPDALRKLMRPLADRQVGGVAGNQVYRKSGAAAGDNEGERIYWDFDRLLKQAESAAGSTISATGAIYAMRRSLFRPIPPGVTDDFVASTTVVAQGHRLVFAPDAIAYEPLAAGGSAEFARKVRVVTQGFRSLIEMRELLNPLVHGCYSLQLFSHKLLRRLTVLPLLVLSATAPVLWTQGHFYQIATLGACGFYACALLGYLSRGTRFAKARFFSVPFFFALVNAAALVALMNVMRGRRVERWTPERKPTRTEAESRPLVASSDGGIA